MTSSKDRKHIVPWWNIILIQSQLCHAQKIIVRFLCLYKQVIILTTTASQLIECNRVYECKINHICITNSKNTALPKIS